MTPEDYKRAGDLFDRVRELPNNERAAALDSACSGNPVLRAQVVRLLEADRVAASGAFLERRAIDDAARLISAEGPRLPASGTIIGNYRLTSRIGAGGMGVVFEGEDLRLHRRVAVKILPLPFAAEGSERIQRFQREARAASLLSHPHIVSIFDADFDQGHYYIAMELVEGKTLRQLIADESQPIDAKTVIDLIGQTASALSAAHDAGVVHRDIKPENIMVRPDGFVKVLDFGLAKLREPSSDPANMVSDLRTRPGLLAGTIQYLSPEQVLGKPAGPTSDLFSLGVVAYELAAGVRPFDGPTDGAVFDAILNRTPAPPSSIRPSLGTALDGVIMQALEKETDLRIQTATDLRSACRRLSRDYILKDGESSREIESPRTLTPSPESRAGVQTVRGRRMWWLVAVGILLAAALFWITRPPPPPHVSSILQITNDGLFKRYFVNDGTRLLYAAGAESLGVKMFQVSAKGGEPVPMVRLNGMFPLDISADRSEMLLGQYLKVDAKGPFPIWIADTLGSAPRRLGDLLADYVRWSPKADEILYCNGPEIGIVRADGSALRKLATLKGLTQTPAWSPDGSTIRFTLLAKNSTALWEMNADGSRLHPLFPSWEHRPHDAGVWTPDGKYFIFSAQDTTHDLWAVRQNGLFGTGAQSPVRLTAGPFAAYRPNPSPDGHRIFFLGGLSHSELVRYDWKSDRWLSYLGGLPAVQVEFSRDGKWLTYASDPGASVWRCASDGSQRSQLTAPPIFARNPRWSPDGSQIAFYGGVPGKPDRIYIVPAAGGAVRQLTHGESGPSGDEDPSWSPDGASLVFGAQSADRTEGPVLEIMDVKTQRISKLPGSQGLWSARWSPDGRYIAALDPKFHLALYNTETRARTQLTSIGAGYPSWSADSQYIYFENNGSTEWYRVRIKDGKVEQMANISGLKMSPAGLGWIGLTPDGALISARDAGSTEIYALDWEP
ncbi:MAG: protein kinase [Bryobacteraceae bacterium]